MNERVVVVGARRFACAVVALGMAACGNDAGGGSSATGGSATSSGGAATVSGGSSSGGTANGGAPSSGGAPPVSGGASMGGATTGGVSGGAPANSGGAAPTWGGMSTGGLTSSGGASAGSAAGGAVAFGGTGNASGGTAGGSGGKGGSGGSPSGGSGGSVSGGAGSGSGGSTSSTCPASALKSGDTTRMVSVDSTSRSYILHVPSTYDGSKAVPLVVDFHPLGGNGSSWSTGSPYRAQTDPDGVITAYPTGLSGPSGGAWNVGPCCVKSPDDVAFAKALVADIEKVACIDAKRVYATGFSMGGGMSHYLACHAADVFAAVAPAAFDLLKENVDACKPARPISVISFRSTGDSLVTYAGGYSAVVQGMPINFLGAKATFAKWAELNQCSGSASAEDANGCASYSGCPGGVEVVLCTKQGGTHEAGNARVGWPLLKKHALP